MVSERQSRHKSDETKYSGEHWCNSIQGSDEWKEIGWEHAVGSLTVFQSQKMESYLIPKLASLADSYETFQGKN